MRPISKHYLRTPLAKITAHFESSGTVHIGIFLSEIGKRSVRYKTADIIATMESKYISFDKE